MPKNQRLTLHHILSRPTQFNEGTFTHSRLHVKQHSDVVNISSRLLLFVRDLYLPNNIQPTQSKLFAFAIFGPLEFCELHTTRWVRVRENMIMTRRKRRTSRLASGQLTTQTQKFTQQRLHIIHLYTHTHTRIQSETETPRHQQQGQARVKRMIKLLGRGLFKVPPSVQSSLIKQKCFAPHNFCVIAKG